MSGKIKITPRARRLAQERGIDLAAIGAQGTGYEGGITEKDLVAWIEAGGGVGAVPAGAVPVAVAVGGDERATSVARKVAAEHGVSLSAVAGSGSFGKIVKEDVLAAIADGSAFAAPARRLDDEVASIGETADGKRIAKVVPYAGTRKVIGDRLSESMFTAPHLYFMQKVDLSDLLELRSLVNAKQGKKTSVTDYIARAVVMTLRTYPEMNASLTAGGIEEYASINLGIAVAAPGGLIVPVVREAQGLSVVGLSKASSELIDKARDGKLSPNEYSGGTFTISNLGMFGIENFTAILNPPEVGILAVSATKDEAVVVGNPDGAKRVDIRPMMNITLSVDHRVVDGLLAAQFVTEVKRLLESPLELMIRDWE
ncbi:MAG: 2-oxo acid dehydrogenase subunit E2 [Clostridiales bacterium]|nr:2-oxo acid dehydrogenase subunit E2 [Clostridiales bacterium]